MSLQHSTAACQEEEGIAGSTSPAFSNLSSRIGSQIAQSVRISRRIDINNPLEEKYILLSDMIQWLEHFRDSCPPPI